MKKAMGLVTKLSRVAIYARVSTEEQAREGYSIRAQIEKLKEYAKIKDWLVYDIYVDDGISGKNLTGRPAIQRLIQDIKDDKIDIVSVFKVDRLTRSVRDLVELIDLFNARNCEFNSLMESIDTATASGRMFLKIIGIFAEFERENTIERITAAFAQKVDEGYTLATFRLVYGYDRPKGSKIYLVNDDEAKVVREIFDLYVNKNISMTKIAQTLNLRGIKTKYGANWSSKTIKLILINSTYIGKIRYHIKTDYQEFEGKHQPIIDIEVFKKVQVKISKIEKKLITKIPKEENFFCGVLYCEKCGRRLSTQHTQKIKKDGTKFYFPSYRCTNRMNKACDAKDMGQKKVETAFLEYVDNIQDFDIVDEIDLNPSKENLKKDNSELILVLEKKINNLISKRSSVMDLFLESKLDFDEYRDMLNKLEKEEHRINEEIKEYNSFEEEIDEEITINRKDVILNIKGNWIHLTNMEKMNFLHMFVEKIVIINEPIEGDHKGNVVIKDIIFHSN